MNLASERGAARLTTAARLGVVLVLFTVIAFDVSAVVVNVFQLDGLSRSAARAAADAWQGAPRASAVEAAVTDEVAPDDTNVEVSRITLDATAVWVTLRRPPAVIVLDKVPAVRERLDISVTQRAALGPTRL
jgi:hypothetical protein